jgi:predicted ATPase/DNA-binding CsgD family transcriptional regulator
MEAVESNNAPTSSHTDTLPRPFTALIGREAELGLIRQQLLDPACRLLTLLGPGGMGKTRLAIEAANGLRDEFVAGVHFVNLQPLSDPAQLPAALADALRLPLSGSDPVARQLQRYLGNKEMLLLLDNFEHLLSGADFLSELLLHAPGLKALVTSREVLNLREEWLVTLAGLAVPPLGFDLQTLEGYSAANLFIERMRRLRPQGVVADEAVAIGHICQLVEGMPLALELAASWTKSLACAEIAIEIERSINFLSTSLRNTPERHRSMLAVFGQSCQQLSEDEQTVFARLSVFRGGFKRDAAQQVVSASLGTLSALVDKSLLRWEGSGRYQIHELLRQFAAERLAADRDEETLTQQRHSRYYLRFLSEQTDKLNSATQRQALEDIDHELDNVRTAWDWSTAHRDAETIALCVDALYDFYQIRSRYQEGQQRFARTLAHFQSAQSSLTGKLAARLSHFCLVMGDHTQTDHLLQPLIHSPDPRERAFVMRQLGDAARFRQSRLTTEAHYRQSLAISREQGDRSGEILAGLELAEELTQTGSLAEARQLAEGCIALCQQQGRPDWLAHAHVALSWCLSCIGDYDDVATHAKAALSLYEQIGDRYNAARAINFMGWAAWCEGGEHIAEAVAHYQQSLQMLKEIGGQSRTAMGLADLALALNDAGEFATARQIASEGLVLSESYDFLNFVVYNHWCLAAASCGLGDFASARDHLLRAMSLAWKLHNLPQLANTFHHLAVLLSAESKWETSATDKRTKQRTAFGILEVVIHNPSTWQAFKTRAAQLQTELERSLPADEITTARQQFVACSIESVVTEMLSLLEQPAPVSMGAAASHTLATPATLPQPLIEPLTERELEILRLIAEGHTNHAIAEKLFLSPGTVKWYSSEIYGKLGVASRIQAVTEARRLKLLE